MPADQGPPSAEVLAALVVSLRSELAQARAELERARERIAELEARLRQTARNSSKPPSSEGLAEPAPRSLRKKSGRRPGGQDGHMRQTLTQVARPDREVWHEPGGCGRCGAALAGRPVTGVERRQVFDLPPVERARASTKAAAPDGAEATVQYGPRIAAVIVYLYIGELQAVTDLAPEREWCWATQAAEALTAMQKLVSEAIRQGRDAVDPAALGTQIHAYRSAALIGASQTAARSSPLMKKYHALAGRLLDRQDDYLRFTRVSIQPVHVR